MKKILFVVLFILSLAPSFAESDSYKTKIEQAVNTKDYLFKQEVFSVDNIPAFRIDALKITNLEKFNVSTGLKVVYSHQFGKESKTLYNYIDTDEIDGVITSLQYMKTILKSKIIPGNYTEIKFVTRSGFLVMLNTILNEDNKLDWGFSAQPDNNVERSMIILKPGDVEKLQKTMEQAKGKL